MMMRVRSSAHVPLCSLFVACRHQGANVSPQGEAWERRADQQLHEGPNEKNVRIMTLNGLSITFQANTFCCMTQFKEQPFHARA